ncbi:hypothetical protein A8139_01085 [Marinomonas primoryensis]|uniref:2-keto-4-pentenoate hydratase n=1 Tax=Marinomonas primoryensis TaxID=178399 RepID=A0A2Z4PMC9_9GAMM|nr:hypothetical protein [Marinomonas primoryensis]AWX98740.1 hypothetical protein A8139_01085 [Marinomonas primoryensis]
MNFTEYSAILRAFEDGAFTSIHDNFDDICHAQDQLIAELTSKGAVIKGWKVVEDSGVFILSPIFDFQIFQNQGTQLPKNALSGIEVEICYQCSVPILASDIAYNVKSSQPLVAIEVLRPKINHNSYPSCDFYYNYGILVSSLPIAGDFTLKSGHQNQTYDYSTSAPDFFEQKRKVLLKGVQECVRRGYIDDFFFMTGSLNGLIGTDICLGINEVIASGSTLISVDVV